MGNVNGREDDGGGGSSPSGVEVEVEEGAPPAAVAADVIAHDTTMAMGVAQSPPPSPRASQSPLMFRPQMPVVPLQRPDEMQVPGPSWMLHSMSGHDNMYYEQGIPTMITWSHDGKEVFVEGSWDNWKTRTILEKSGKDFTVMKVLPSGVYQYRFIVDGQWRYLPDMPWIQDEMGNACNILDLEDYVPEDVESISGFEAPQSPESSYNNSQLVAEDYAKEPPLVPPHLQMTLLNVPSAQMEIPPPYSRPQHVILNHLYMQKGRSSPSVVALGSTNRFLSKYVTVVLYKSIQR
ncbi:OLC1v1021111C1 [Oldenlandia corymbosa var. corymbosa]|uniref:OLC1v1021111C1 n=1 Tax=Oldenlandia corymbosa var. corymbosa TaxID=529605 RepID=A0AAV1BUY2_OLDCO|nr:OLC1v1021111C1 [Oldenlandia corymbosa var. corymbosa]